MEELTKVNTTIQRIMYQVYVKFVENSYNKE